jgi:hypothetical protein
MFDLQTIVNRNKMTTEINPDRMGFQVCDIIVEKTDEIAEELNTVQGMMPIDSDHNAATMMSILRKAKIVALVSTMNMRLGGEDLEFLKELRGELNDLARESQKQLEDLDAKIERKNKAAGNR